VKILLWIILKVHALHYANELLVCVRLFFTFLFINICKLAQEEETTKEKCSGKINDSYLLSIKVQTTIIHISICFLPRQRIFFQVHSLSASWKRHCATHWREQRGWTLIENGKLGNQIARLAAIVVKLNTPLFRYFCNHLSNYTKTIIRLRLVIIVEYSPGLRLGKYLAIIEWGLVGYEEFCRSRRVLSTEAKGRGGYHPPRSAEFFISYESRIQ